MKLGHDKEMELDLRIFDVGETVYIKEAKWHFKEEDLPIKATISQEMHKGWMYRCTVEGWDYEFGPYHSDQLLSEDEFRGKAKSVPLEDEGGEEPAEEINEEIMKKLKKRRDKRNKKKKGFFT